MALKAVVFKLLVFIFFLLNFETATTHGTDKTAVSSSLQDKTVGKGIPRLQILPENFKNRRYTNFTALSNSKKYFC